MKDIPLPILQNDQISSSAIAGIYDDKPIGRPSDSPIDLVEAESSPQESIEVFGIGTERSTAQELPVERISGELTEDIEALLECLMDMGPALTSPSPEVSTDTLDSGEMASSTTLENYAAAHGQAQGSWPKRLAQQQMSDQESHAFQVDDGITDTKTVRPGCYCGRPNFGKMVACGGPTCDRKVFHLECTESSTTRTANGKTKHLMLGVFRRWMFMLTLHAVDVWCCLDCSEYRDLQKAVYFRWGRVLRASMHVAGSRT